MFCILLASVAESLGQADHPSVESYKYLKQLVVSEVNSASEKTKWSKARWLRHDDANT